MKMMLVKMIFKNNTFIDKIEISLNAVGKAGILKLRKVAVKKRQTFQHVITFVRN